MAIVQRNVQVKAVAAGDDGALERCQSMAGLVSGHDGDRHHRSLPRGGGKVAFKVKSAGMSMSITETVLDYQPDKLQLFQMEGMLSGRARWELTPEGDGTRLTTTFDYALPGGVFGKIADALIVKRMNAQEPRGSSSQLQSARRTGVAHVTSTRKLWK